MIKTKLLRATTYSKESLDESINDFLKDLNDVYYFHLIDIKYSTCVEPNQAVYYSALIIYDLIG